MKRQKRVLQVVSIALCTMMLCATAYIGQPEVVQIEEEPCALGDSVGTLIEYAEEDLTVIPDKYNTGAKGNLVTVEIGALVNGIQFSAGSNSTRQVLDFVYRNKSVSGTVTFENYDFSKFPLWIYHEDKVNRQIKIVFENCKFSEVSVGKENDKLTYEFNNCTMESFKGSNSVLNNCHFTKGNTDGVVPIQNIEVNNCFFSDMASKAASGKEVHTDGTQIYGTEGIDVLNVSYSNCRFEIPPLSIEGSTAYINACIMLQLEYSNAKNVFFKDCIVNGGGYSIYAWDKNKGYTFENVEFNGILSGCAKTYNTLYTTVNPTVKIEDIGETDSLYVASVWKEGGNTHFSVSNDTNQERILFIYTDKGTYEYTIPACPTGKQLDSSMTYDELPFDIDIMVPQDCKYAVCYDNTLEGYAKQIRFVNWSGQDVCLEKNIIEELTSKGDEVIASGKCGADVEFFLTKEGVLTLSGDGDTESYNSGKLSPWSEYNDFIKEIKVEEGIEKLGNQIFRNCAGVRTILLPDSLVAIGSRAFMKCTSLTSITLPGSLESLGDCAFLGVALQEIRYEGKDWNTIELGKENESLASEVVYVLEEEQGTVNNIILQGECGKDVEFVLTEDGVLRIIGVGATDNYNSCKTAPWYETRDLIKTVVVEEGIEKLGTQLFRKCSNLEQVDLPNSLEIIGANSFISCSNLNNIVIPSQVKEIQRYAFAGIPVLLAVYEGTEQSWNQITVGECNGSLLSNICFK